MTFRELEKQARNEYERVESEDALIILSIVIDLLKELAEKENEE